MALMWIGALLEPPIAEQATMAFSNASRGRMAEGLRFSCTISTPRPPGPAAICARLREGGGMAAQPGSERPTAAGRGFMVEAVPMVLQWPIDGAEDATRSRNSL